VSKEEDILKKINELSKRGDKEDLETLKSLVWLVFQHETKQHDLYFLAKLLPLEMIIDLVEFYDGAEMRIPSKKEFREALAVVVATHMDMNGHSWEDIKTSLGLRDKEYFNSISIGKKVKSIKIDIKQQIHKLLKKSAKEVEELAKRIFL